MNRKSLFSAICIAAIAATASYGQLTDYSQDFEGFTLSEDIDFDGDIGSTELGDDGWLVSGANFLGTPDSPGNFQFFFGNFPAPSFSNNLQFTRVSGFQGTGTQGFRHLSVFSAYDEPVSHSGTTSFLDARVLQEQTISAADLGNTVTFDFEFKRHFEDNTDFGPVGNTNTFAFIRVLNSLDGTFATLAESNIETTGADLTTWTQDQARLLIDPSFDGQLLQFGFFSETQNSNFSLIVYDNLNFSAASVLLGDVNLDGSVNFADISPFIGLLSSGLFQAEGDTNQDGAVNFADISPFIAILSGN